MEDQSYRHFEEREDVIDLKELFFKFLNHWVWFAAAIPCCVFIAFWICMLQTPKYKVEMKVMVSDSKKGELGQNIMLKELGFTQNGDRLVENEMVELQSKNLILEVVKELDLGISYFREGFPRRKDLYVSSPIRILTDYPENIKDTCIRVETSKTGVVRVSTLEDEIIYEGKYSDAIPMGNYRISVEKTDSVFSDSKILVQLLSFETATDHYTSKLSVSLLGKNTNALKIGIEDAVPQRGIHILNTLIQCYNERGTAERQLVSTKTVEFINERLKIINQELGSIEDDAEHFKKLNRLTDLTSDAALVMERKKTADAELLKLETELAVVKGIADFLEESPGKYNLLPDNLGLTDIALANGITQYNEMVLRRSKLLMTANNSNPLVVSLSNQLNDLRDNICIAIQNVIKTQEIKIKTLAEENHLVDRRLTSVPTQEKQYRAIARQQELKENLFLFLMQKREEAEIAKLMYLPIAKIIENARSSKSPVAPNKKLILLGGLLIGCILPVGFILLLEMVNSKVREVAEVEKEVKAPLLGCIPELQAGKTDIFENDHFMLIESMQLIRERLNYLIQQNSCPVIMVTSTTGGEGKSMISAHLSNAYAKVGKKVLVIGCDLRNPQLGTFFLRENTKGLSAYLAEFTDDPADIINNVLPDLDVIFGGAVPPNPAQLVASPRMEVLLDTLKTKYDYIILDTPPVGLLADGFSLSRYVDACVYVVRANVLEKEALKIVSRIVEEKQIKNIGILVNGIKTVNNRYGYGYRYAYGYGKSKK